MVDSEPSVSPPPPIFPWVDVYKHFLFFHNEDKAESADGELASAPRDSKSARGVDSEVKRTEQHVRSTENESLLHAYQHPAVKVGHIPGKGRGLVTTEDLPAGTLLLVEKAFAWGADWDDIVTTVEHELSGAAERPPDANAGRARDEDAYAERCSDYLTTDGHCILEDSEGEACAVDLFGFVDEEQEEQEEQQKEREPDNASHSGQAAGEGQWSAELAEKRRQFFACSDGSAESESVIPGPAAPPEESLPAGSAALGSADRSRIRSILSCNRHCVMVREPRPAGPRAVGATPAGRVVNDPDRTALFLFAHFINHSSLPNCHRLVLAPAEGPAWIVLRACVPVRAGAELLDKYCDPFAPGWERQEALKLFKFEERDWREHLEERVLDPQTVRWLLQRARKLRHQLDSAAKRTAAAASKSEGGEGRAILREEKGAKGRTAPEAQLLRKAKTLALEVRQYVRKALRAHVAAALRLPSPEGAQAGLVPTEDAMKAGPDPVRGEERDEQAADEVPVEESSRGAADEVPVKESSWGAVDEVPVEESSGGVGKPEDDASGSSHYHLLLASFFEVFTTYARAVTRYSYDMDQALVEWEADRQLQTARQEQKQEGQGQVKEGGERQQQDQDQGGRQQQQGREDQEQQPEQWPEGRERQHEQRQGEQDERQEQSNEWERERKRERQEEARRVEAVRKERAELQEEACEAWALCEAIAQRVMPCSNLHCEMANEKLRCCVLQQLSGQADRRRRLSDSPGRSMGRQRSEAGVVSTSDCNPNILLPAALSAIDAAVTGVLRVFDKTYCYRGVEADEDAANEQAFAVWELLSKDCFTREAREGIRTLQAAHIHHVSP